MLRTTFAGMLAVQLWRYDVASDIAHMGDSGDTCSNGEEFGSKAKSRSKFLTLDRLELSQESLLKHIYAPDETPFHN